MTIVFVVGGSVPSAVLARITVETTNDPTSHNLWPLELIAALVGGACSSAGTLVGNLPSVFIER